MALVLEFGMTLSSCICFSIGFLNASVTPIFFIFQSEHIVRIIDSRIFDQEPRAICILMELGEMDFDNYLQSPAPVPEGTMPHCQSQRQGQGFHGGRASR